MLDNAMRILISHQEMERLVTQAQDAEHAPTTTAPWPTVSGFSLMPDRGVEYGPHQLESVVAEPGELRSARTVLFALDARTGRTQQIQHRVIVYDNHQATAQSGSNAAGNVSDQQMDQDTRLVSAVLDLLTGDAGILIQQPPIAGDTTLGPDDPPRWRWERQGKKADPIPVELTPFLGRPARRPEETQSGPKTGLQSLRNGPCWHSHFCATQLAQLCHLPVFE